MLFRSEYMNLNRVRAFNSEFDIRVRRAYPPFAQSHCWGPSASEGPQKHDLTMFSK